ncbi:methyltransferase domain-containing protein [Thermodesulfobacteriota bacterium]
MSGQVIAGNVYDKYNSRNPIVRKLMGGFYGSMLDLLEGLDYHQVLDTGCGEGYLTKRFFNPVSRLTLSSIKVTAIDISPDIIEVAKESDEAINFLCASVYELPFEDDFFDMVVANEVLEHVDKPELALAELDRVCRKYFLVSVPREPVWRMMNLGRFRYLTALGNTPGHVNHWSVNRFLKLLANHFNVVRIKTPLPWTIALCRKRSLPSL